MNRRIRMRARLAILDMTCADLAGRVGVSVGSISQYINGNRNPRPPVAERIAKALQTTVEDLALQEVV